MAEVATFSCQFDGCRKRFNHRMQCHRHMEKYHPDGLKEKCDVKLPFLVTDNGKFSCVKCGKTSTHRPSVYRHVDNCDPKFKANEHTCLHCGIEFQYASRLKAHLKKHEKELLQWICESCGKDFVREDHFRKHSEKCLNGESPSFVREEEMILQEANDKIITPHVEENHNQAIQIDLNIHPSNGADDINPDDDDSDNCNEKRVKSRKTLMLESLLSSVTK